MDHSHHFDVRVSRLIIPPGQILADLAIRVTLKDDLDSTDWVCQRWGWQTPVKAGVPSTNHGLTTQQVWVKGDGGLRESLILGPQVQTNC